MCFLTRSGPAGLPKADIWRLIRFQSREADRTQDEDDDDVDVAVDVGSRTGSRTSAEHFRRYPRARRAAPATSRERGKAWLDALHSPPPSRPERTQLSLSLSLASRLRTGVLSAVLLSSCFGVLVVLAVFCSVSCGCLQCLQCGVLERGVAYAVAGGAARERVCRVSFFVSETKEVVRMAPNIGVVKRLTA